MNLLRKVDGMIGRACRFFIVFLTLFLTVLMSTSVALRYLFGTSFPAIEELSVLLGLWLYFASMVLVTRERSHLHGGIIDLIKMNATTRKTIVYFNNLFCFLVTGLFGFYTIKYLLFVMKINRSSTTLQWPTALWVSAAVAGFVLMVIYLGRELFSLKLKVGDYDYKSPHPDKIEPTGGEKCSS